MKEHTLPEFTRPASVEKVLFKDGMIVTAEDLNSAMHYPVNLFQTLFRAFFGCGVVCGLEVKEPEGAGEDNTCIEVSPGIALDCQPHPVELCKLLKIDLTPDPCESNPPLDLCLAIRRTETKEHPRMMSDCSEKASGTDYQCTRIREQVVVKVFDARKLPGILCSHSNHSDTGSAEDSAEGNGATYRAEREFHICQCLKTCPDHHCCGDAWVLLACVTRDECGRITRVDQNRRSYVKPIACLCQWEDRIGQKFDQISNGISKVEKTPSDYAGQKK